MNADSRSGNRSNVTRFTSIRCIPRVELLETRETPAIGLSATAVWQDLGPNQIQNGQTAGITNNPVIGAIDAIYASRSNPNLIFAGGTNGGVWRTFNGTAVAPTWTPLTDNLSSLSVSDISIDPTNNDRVLVGIGGTSDTGYRDQTHRDATGTVRTPRPLIRGDLIGPIFSTNATAAVPTWTVLSGLANQEVVKVYVRANNMLVATKNGVFRSLDDGASFVLCSGTAGDVFDLAEDPGNPNRFYAAVKASPTATPQILRTDNGGATFGVVTDNTYMRMSANTVNVKISVFNQSSINDVVYVAVANNNPPAVDVNISNSNPASPAGPWADNSTGRAAYLTSVSWSTNQGGNWTRMDNPRHLGALQALTGATARLNAGVATGTTRHRLQTGDQIFIKNADNNVTDTVPPILFLGNNNAVDNNGIIVTPELWYVNVRNETDFTVHATLADALAGTNPFATGDANPRANPPGQTGTYQILESLNVGERGEFLDIVADANNPSLVYIGGMSPYTLGNEVGSQGFTSSLWRGDRTVAGNAGNYYVSSQWSPITNNPGTAQTRNPGAGFFNTVNNGVVTGNPGWQGTSFNTNNAAPSADPREMFIDANGQLLVASGGGLYRNTVPNGTGAWSSVNGNLGVAQVWSVAWDQVAQRAFAGFADTAAAQQTATGSGVYDTVLSTARLSNTFIQSNVYTVLVDNSQVAAPGQAIRYYVGGNFGTIFRQVGSGPLTALTFASPASQTLAFSGLVGVDGGGWQAENQPIEMQLNLNDPRRALYGTTQVYEDSDPIGPSGNVVNNVTPAGMTGRVRSIAYGGKRGGANFNQVAYIGTSTGQLFRRGEFGVLYDNLNPPGGSAPITDIAVDPDDWRHVYVVKAGRIFETFNGETAAPSWTDVSFNLVGPVTANGTPGNNFLTTEIQTIALWDGAPGTTVGGVTLVAGGRGGVFRLNFDPTCNLQVWNEYGTALPNTVVTDLHFNRDRLVAGTMGRGIWTIPDVRPTILGATLIVTGDGTANAMSIVQDFSDPTDPNRVTVADGLGNQQTFTFGEFNKVQFNALGGADTILIGSTGFGLDSRLDFIRFYIEVNAGGNAGDVININAQGATVDTRATITSNSVGYNPNYDNLFGSCGYLGYTGLNLGNLQVYTGSKNDSFLVLGGVLPPAVNLIGAAGDDQYVLQGGGTTGTVGITDTNGNDVALVYGSEGVDTMTMDKGIVAIGNFAALYDQNQLETMYLDGLGAVDTLIRVGTTGSDNMIVRQYGPSNGHVAGLPGTFPIFSNFEDLSIIGNGGNDSLFWEDRTDGVYGSAANPAAGLVYKPTGGSSGELRIGNSAFNIPLTTLRFTGVTGSFIASGDPDGTGDLDTITVVAPSTSSFLPEFGEALATDGSDSVTATDEFVSVSNTSLGQLRPIFFGASSNTKISFSTIFVRTGKETIVGDSVYAVPTLRTNLIIDGGLPTTAPGDSITVGVAGNRVITTSTNPLLGPTHKRVTQTSNGASVGYLNFENVKTVNTTVVPPPGVSPPPPTPVGTQLFAAVTDSGVPVQLRAYNSTTGALLFGGPIAPFGAFAGGASVAVGDVNGDGNQDIAVAAGPGGGPQVIIYNGSTGKQLFSFFAFESNFKGGVNVALSDVNGDGFADIIAGAGPGGGPRVRVISGIDRSTVLHDFFAFEPTFRGGVNVAGADLSGDGTADLVVGSASKADRVRTIRLPDRAVLSEFRAYGGFTGGVNIGTGDVTGDGIADIITGAGNGGGPHVKVFNGVGNGEIRSFFVNDTTLPGQQPIALSGGVRVAGVDQDDDGLTDILTGLGRGAKPLAQIFKVSRSSGGTIGSVLTPLLAVNTFGNTYGGGIFVG
jgi:hypothetical protein